ncbi:phenylacetic acid degradation protein [Streptomyces sulfonofaciens]|uniref:Phenylacetic acid degradation protein n=1 Tax=Streptomyces sulfonofaciens TaxID=68272 RepID=A0A919FQ64_9ACTN|nr:1,2-phenylacetyl-CoA epoxidase subunit PaaC [Streptomyces sulfonofaciens]GHH70412.1 phenylacetic acid degradation protein [Streptomyces sulfonofaciens]
MTATAETAPVLALGDDALVLSHRLGEWAGHAPVLEEEVALANIALDLLGQARVLLSLVGDEDELAYLREERAFRNCQLVEQPNGDFAHTIARQLYFSTYQHLLYARLAAAGDGSGPLAALAAKAVKEVAYHQDHARQWTLRLGDGTDESHRRMQRGCESLWRFTGELFQPLGGAQGPAEDVRPGSRPGGVGDGGLGDGGLVVDWAALEADWLSSVTAVLEEATLSVPDGPRRGAWSAGAGRQGVHTEAFGRMLAEMQHLHRSHPGASW